MGAVATETVLATVVVMETVLMASVGTEEQLIIYKYIERIIYINIEGIKKIMHFEGATDHAGGW